MNEQEALKRLCELCGITTDYHDIWGNHHVAQEPTLRRLLAAMGTPSDTEEQIRQAIHAFEDRAWKSLLPPVRVRREEEPPFLTVTIPAHRENETFPWRLTLENGETQGGTFRPADLPVADSHIADSVTYNRYALPLPFTPNLGYHRFELEDAAMTLIVAPARCYEPAAIRGDGRVWGPAVQAYSLRSRENWGMGDFSDLKDMVKFCAHTDASVIGVNPLHALFPDNPEHAVPYGPSSRLFLNILYVSVEDIADFAESEAARAMVKESAFQAELQALRDEPMVQYTRVAAAKFPVLEQLYRHFREKHLSPLSERGRQFRAFQRAKGEPLRRQALFETLQTRFRAADQGVWGWPAWPEAYRNPDSPEVATFYAENRERVEFYEYLQWQADLQLQDVGKESFHRGLGIGLLLDLAVGVNRGGAETWADQSIYTMQASVGAPADDFNLHGQNWGLPPMIPHRLQEASYAPLIATFRECMVHAGALRIDHVMGLMRQFWVPEGMSALHGAYVNYPLDDLLGILALESHRNQCLVVGEDLGTVPDALRVVLKEQGVLSYRLLYFERHSDGTFKRPEEFPSLALAAVSTHDLPTFAGYWSGRDIEVRHQLGLYPTEDQHHGHAASRTDERNRLTSALEQEGLLPEGGVPLPEQEMTQEFNQAVQAYLARSRAKVMLVQMEDIFGQQDQVNLPGTTEEKYPNWRRKLTVDIEDWESDPRATGMAETLQRERGDAEQRHREVA